MCVTVGDLPECPGILDSLKELQGHCSGCSIITCSDPRLRAKSLLHGKKKRRNVSVVKTESDA